MTDYKVDIFGVMSQLDKGDYFVYENTPEENRKELVPFMLMKWMSGTSDKKQILKINAIVNSLAFQIPKHQGLHMKLLAIASNKRPQRYTWIGTKKKSEKSKPTSIDVIRQYYGYSRSEASEVLVLYDHDNIVQMANKLGYQKEDIQKIKKEW